MFWSPYGSLDRTLTIAAAKTFNTLMILHFLFLCVNLLILAPFDVSFT